MDYKDWFLVIATVVLLITQILTMLKLGRTSIKASLLVIFSIEFTIYLVVYLQSLLY